MGAEKLLGFDVAGTGGPARTDGGEFAGVFVGVCAGKVGLGVEGEGGEEGQRGEENRCSRYPTSQNRDVGHPAVVLDGEGEFEVCGFPPIERKTLDGWGTHHSL